MEKRPAAKAAGRLSVEGGREFLVHASRECRKPAAAPTKRTTDAAIGKSDSDAMSNAFVGPAGSITPNIQYTLARNIAKPAIMSPTNATRIPCSALYAKRTVATATMSMNACAPCPTYQAHDQATTDATTPAQRTLRQAGTRQAMFLALISFLSSRSYVQEGSVPTLSQAIDRRSHPQCPGLAVPVRTTQASPKRQSE